MLQAIMFLNQATLITNYQNTNLETALKKNKIHVHAKILQLHLILCNPLDYTACQPPLSVGFSRQRYWGGLPCPPPGDLPESGIEYMSLLSPAMAGSFLLLAPPGKHRHKYIEV